MTSDESHAILARQGLTPEQVAKMPIKERVRRLKILTPGKYGLHWWADHHGGNGAVIDCLLLHAAIGANFSEFI